MVPTGALSLPNCETTGYLQGINFSLYAYPLARSFFATGTVAPSVHQFEFPEQYQPVTPFIFKYPEVGTPGFVVPL